MTPRTFTPCPDRIAAALAGPNREVLTLIALQPIYNSSRHFPLHLIIPVPRPMTCPTCGQARP